MNQPSATTFSPTGIFNVVVDRGQHGKILMLPKIDRSMDTQCITAHSMEHTIWSYNSVQTQLKPKSVVTLVLDSEEGLQVETSVSQTRK